MIKNIRSIYLRDLRAILKNKAALLTILALCVLPSLYTLINVGAIWNPYSAQETGRIPVAVVNEDLGANLNNQQINFGTQVIKTLHSNNKIGWRFVDKDTAEHRLKQGKYYAEIIIPKNFSAKLTSIASANPQRATVVFKTNTKNSPMGIKITETAAQTLVTQIKNKFVYQINETVFSYLNKVGNKLGNNQANILQLKDLIIALDDGMDLATNSLTSINGTASGMATALEELKTFNSATQGNNTLQSISELNSSGLQSARSSLNSAADNIKDNINQVTARQTRLNQLYGQLNRAVNQNNRARVNSLAQEAKSEIDVLQSQTKILSAFLSAFDNSNPQINSLSNQLTTANNRLSSEASAIRSLQSSTNGSTAALQSATSRAIQTNQRVNQNLGSSLNTSINNASAAIDSAVASMINSSR